MESKGLLKSPASQLLQALHVSFRDSEEISTISQQSVLSLLQSQVRDLDVNSHIPQVNSELLCIRFIALDS